MSTYLATQTLVIEAGEAVYKAYTDTAGNKVVTGDASAHAVAEEEAPQFLPKVPTPAKDKIGPFFQEIAEGTAADFNNIEHDQLDGLTRLITGGDVDASNRELAFKAMIDTNKAFAVPLVPNGQYKQHSVAGGGFLVAPPLRRRRER